MRVVLTVNFSPWSRYAGGGQRSTHALATALSRRGHDVTVIYTKPPRERVDVPKQLPYALVWAAFVARTSRSSAPLRTLNAVPVARRVAALHRTRRIDVVHCQGEEGALVPLVRTGSVSARRVTERVPFGLVVTPRYPAYPSALAASGRGLRAHVARAFVHPKYRALGHLLRRADVVCPTSDASARELARLFDLDRVRIDVVPNGVDEAFGAATRDATVEREDIVYFGRLERGKGVDVLLESYAALGPDAPKLRVIGRGSLAPLLTRWTAERGLGPKISFEPWLDAASLASRLATARLAVLPSREESFGNAMVEAMATGVPLVTTRVGSIPEVTDGGRLARLVPPSDAAALADAMRLALADRAGAEARAAEARLHVLSTYGWDTTAERFEAIYARVVTRA